MIVLLHHAEEAFSTRLLGGVANELMTRNSAGLVATVIGETGWFVSHWVLLCTAKVCHRISTWELQKASRQDLVSWAVQDVLYEALRY